MHRIFLYPNSYLSLCYDYASAGPHYECGPQSVEKEFFDRLAEVEKGPKTRKTKLSAYIGTVGFVFRSKSKCLASQGLSALFFLKLMFCSKLKNNGKPQTVTKFILTVRGFIDTLKGCTVCLQYILLLCHSNSCLSLCYDYASVGPHSSCGRNYGAFFTATLRMRPYRGCSTNRKLSCPRNRAAADDQIPVVEHYGLTGGDGSLGFCKFHPDALTVGINGGLLGQMP